MKNIDKTILLFETLLDVSDPTLVNHKINDIQASPEYKKLGAWISTAAKTQILEDVVKRYHAINIYGITAYDEALTTEQELIDLDRRVTDFTGINPYLANGSEKDYKVKALGDIGVEINARGIHLNEFTTNKNVSRINRRKVIIMKAFGWYREAKIVLKDIQDELKALITRVRSSKVKFNSLNFEHFFANLLFAGSILVFFFGPLNSFVKWREDGYDPLINTILFGLTCGLGLATILVNIIHARYKTYAFHLASGVRRQIIGQRVMIDDLEKSSVKLEKELAKKVKKPRKLRIPLENVSIIRKYSRKTNAEILDYVYSENDYFYQKNRGLLNFMHVMFFIGVLCTAAIIAILVIL
ncbi:MAG: hypothetical protein IJV94_01110 [Bacilli bacterium]|nr:hypothetical protein [Bacilli bacterium]